MLQGAEIGRSHFVRLHRQGTAPSWHDKLEAMGQRPQGMLSGLATYCERLAPPARPMGLPAPMAPPEHRELRVSNILGPGDINRSVQLQHALLGFQTPDPVVLRRSLTHERGLAQRSMITSALRTD